MAADNKIEIMLITDYRECLLSKIESLKGSLGQIASSFGNEVSSNCGIGIKAENKISRWCNRFVAVYVWNRKTVRFKGKLLCR